MRRRPYSQEKQEADPNKGPSKLHELVESSKWLDTIQTAIYLKKFRKDGNPSVGAIRNLVYRGKLRARKFFGRLLFNRLELDHLISSSPTVGG